MYGGTSAQSYSVSSLDRYWSIECSSLQRVRWGPECTAVAAMQLRMRMRILTRPENSLANFGRQISKGKLRIKRCQLIRWRLRMVLRMKSLKFQGGPGSVRFGYGLQFRFRFLENCSGSTFGFGKNGSDGSGSGSVPEPP